jgi:hypothetical protein
MKILKKIIDQGIEELSEKKLNPRIDNIIVGKSLYTMKNCNSVFEDMNLCLVLLENSSGFSYFQDQIDFSYYHDFVDLPLIEALKKPDLKPFFRTALADALYSEINHSDKKNDGILKGNLRNKAQQRAKLLLSEIPSGSKVLLAGAVTEIIEESAKLDISLTVTDLEPSKIGLEFKNSVVLDGHEETFKALVESDYAIISGMVFVSETADKIFSLAKESGTKLIFFMETGANFGYKLTDFGAHKVLSEFFPFYDFYGETKYKISSK